MDYGFMSKRDEEQQTNPFFVMVDSKTNEKFARSVNQKGLGQHGEVDWLIKSVVDELNSWGYNGGPSGHIRMKSDGEPAIKQVRRAIAGILGGRVVQEDIPKGESQSNGLAETSIRTVREFTRVFIDMLQDKTHTPIPFDHPVRQWAVRWAAMVPSRFLKGKDKQTPYQRRSGRPFSCLLYTSDAADD